MAGNTQEFVTIIRLNSEEAKNNLADLKRKVDELTVARDKAISAKADTNFIKDLNKDLKKLEQSLKLMIRISTKLSRQSILCRRLLSAR